VGQIALSNDGSFTLTEWVYSNGKAQQVTANGTYTVGQDCTLSLTFTQTPGTGTGVTFQAPASFRGTLNTTASTSTGGTVNFATGSLIIQPQSVTTAIGRFVSQ
jgi:hypothetical protein